jgi:hypothetical protein
LNIDSILSIQETIFNRGGKMQFLALILLFFLIPGLIFSESKRVQKFKKNLQKVAIFKKNMQTEYQDYYLPRKRYIDKQPVDPATGQIYQVYLIQRGANLREKHSNNRKEILKLEKFLETADDFQLGRYFGPNEEKFLSLKAKDSIRLIKEAAEKDEKWRIKNDPVFAKYLQDEARREERLYYLTHKAEFYSEKSGFELISVLRSKVYSE